MKFGSQLPEAIYERFFELDHGHKQVVCAAALVWYFNADPETQRVYREWARAISEGFATIEQPPETVRSFLESRRRPSAGRTTKKP
jgi:hypothetical protein